MFQKNKPMSILDWWLFWIIMIIPLLNIVMFFVFLFSSNTNKSLKNYFLAMLIPLVLIIGFIIVVGVSLDFNSIFEQIADQIPTS